MLINRLYELLSGLLPVRKINQVAKRRAPSVGALERLEERLVMTVDVWTGASSNLWSDNGNWQDNSAPTAGEDLVFPATATNKTAVYDSGLGVSSFGSIDIQSSGYDISTSFSSSLTLTSGLSASYDTSISNFDIDFDTGNGTVSIGTGGTLELGGVISGTSGLNVSGGGTLQVAGTSSNIFTGSTIVASATTLVLDKSSAIAVPGALSISSGGTVQLAQSDQIADASSVTAGTGATLDLNNFDDTIGTLNLTGATVSTGAGTITLGGDVTTNSDNNTSVISGNLDLGGATRTFTVANNAQLDPDLSITANISGTGAGLIKAGANSQLKLSGNNTYDGTTTITAGAIEIASDNALGSSSAGTIVNSGFSLALLGNITVPEPITMYGVGFGGLGAVFNGNGNNTITGAITLGSSSTIGSLSGNLTFSGVISDGASSFALTKVCAGTVTLTNANTYDGGTFITNGLNGSGVLAITNGAALGTGSVSISSGNELDLSNDITLSRNISFAGSGVGGNGALRSVSGNNVYSGTATVQANNSRIKVDAGQLEFSGDLTDGNNNYGVDKFGAGVMLVSGNLTSTLNLHAVEGDVRVTGSDSSTITLYGGVVSGTGTIGTLNHAGGSYGTINPGTGGSTTGILATTDGFQLGATGTFHIDIGGTTEGTTYDQIANNSSGSVDITGSTIEVALVNGFIPAIGDIFTVIDNQSGVAIVGTFNNLADGDTFTSGNVTYQVSYAGGNGTSVTLTVVAVTYTWTGLGGDSNWTTAANWDANQAPVGGEDLVFPSGAARLSNNNDLSGESFHSITIAASDYDINGNAITLTNGISYSSSSGTAEFHPNITLTGTETIDVADGGDFIVSGAISGSGFGITKTGGGTLEYTGFSANTYTGTTTVEAGTLILNRASGINAIAGNLVIGDNIDGGEYVQVGNNNQIADASTVTVNEGATFDLGGSTDAISSLTVQGAAVTVGTGGVLGISDITSNTATTHATSTISGAGILLLNNSFGTLLPITVAQDVSANVDLRIGTSITGNNRGIQKLGNGTLALSGTGSTYDNNTNAEAGILLIETDTALGNTNTVVVATGGSIDFAGANLSIDRGINIANGAGFNGGNAIGVLSGSTTLTGPIGLFADAQIGAADNSTLAINGTIFEDIDPPFFSITVSNGANGRTILGGDNSANFRGDINIVSGFLQAANDNALGMPGVSTTVTVQSGATLELAGGITIPSTKTIAISGVPVANSSKIASLSGNNTIQGDIPITGGNNESFDVASGTTLTVAGVISGSLDFDKNNTGTLILTGTNSNTGNVNVGDGTLLVNGSLATSNLVFVDGRLGGSGTVSNVIISSIGTLAPGNSPGILNTGNLAFSDSGSTYSVEINGPTAGTEYDQTSVVGTVDLGNATLSLSLGYLPTVGTVFTIIDNDGSDAITSGFNGLAEGSTIAFGNSTFQISYVGGTGNDVTLTLLARTDTWTGLGGDNNWSTAANWASGSAPIAGDDLLFPVGAARLTNVNDFASGTLFGSITVASAGYAITGNAITLTDGVASTYVAGSSTFGLNTTLTGTETFNIASGGTLDMSGTITVNNFGGGYGVTKTGGGTLRYSGSTANLYNGTTTINAGTLQLAKSDDVIAANGSVIVGDNTVGATLEVVGNNQFWVGADVTVNEGSTFDVGTHVEHISNLNLQGSTVQIDAAGVLYTFVGVNTFATTNNVTSTIQGLGALEIDNSVNTFTTADDAELAVELSISTTIQGQILSSGLNINGPGTVALSGTNTFGGDVTVYSGAIQVESNNALGTTVGTTTVISGASVYFNGMNLSIAETFDNVAGSGVGGNNLFQVISGSATLTGATEMTGSIQIGAADGTTLTINGVIDDGAGTFGLTVANGVTGRTVLGGNNGFDGGVHVTLGYLRAASDGALGDTTTSSTASFDDRSSLELFGGMTIPATKSITFSLNGAQSIDPKLLNIAGDNTIDGVITLVGNEEFSSASGTTLTLAGNIDQAGGNRFVLSSGPGTIVLSGTSSYTGTTYLTGGVLLVDGDISASSAVSSFGVGTLGGSGTIPAFTLASGNTLAPGNSSGTLSSGNAKFASGTTYSVELDGTTVGTQYDQTDVTGTVTLAGATLSVSLGYRPAVGDSFTLVNNDGSDPVSGTFSGLAEGSTIYIGPVGMTISYVGGDGNDVVLNVTSVTYIWDGGGTDDLWTDAANWVGDVTPAAGSDLVFPLGADRVSNVNDFAVGTAFHSITIAAADYTLTGNALELLAGVTTTYVGTSTLMLDIELGADQTFDTGAGGTLVDAGALSGMGLLTKSGAGTLLLQGSNTYSGGTTVAAGNLGINNNSSLGSGNVLNQAEIDVTNNILLNNNFTVDSSGTAFVIDGLTTIQGTFTLLADTTIQKTDYSNLYLNGVIDGGFGLISTGNGTLGLGQANTYTGGTTIHGGYLQVFNSQATGTVGTVALDSGTTLIDTATTYDLPSGGLTLADGSTFLVALPNSQTVNGPIAVTGLPTFYVAEDGDLSVTGVISGSGGFKKSGGGEVVLAGINTYDGTTIVEAGLLRLTGSATLGSTTGETIIDDDAVLSFNVTPLSTIAEPITAGSAGGTAIIQQYGGPFTLSGGITLNSNLRVDVQGATMTLSGDISDGAGQFGIAKQFGDLVLSGTNTYDGSTDIISGSLYITSSSGLGSTVGGTVVRDGGVLSFETSGDNTISEAITLGNNGGDAYLNNVAGNNVLTGPIILAATGNLEGNGGSLELSGLISDGGATYGLKKLGGNDVTISHANTFDGTVAVNQGDLIVSDVGALGSTLAGTDIGPNGRLVFNLTGQIAEGINFTAAGATLKNAGGNAILSAPVSLTATDVIDISSGSLLISGNITGTGGFEKQGSGILALSGTNDFQGDTLLSAGQTTVRSDSALSTTDVTISDGAFLDLDGSLGLDASSLTVRGNGTGNGAVVSSSGNSTYSGPVIMVANTTIGTVTGTSVTLSGIISGTASLTKSGQGQLILAGSNTFDGNVTAADGNLQASNSNAFGDPTASSTVSATTGATLELSGGITIPATKSVNLSGIPAAGASKIANLNNNNSIQGNLALSGGNNESIDVASGTTLTLTGIISGTLDLDKNGTGTLVLTGISTLTGQVNVGAGTLLVNGQLSTPSLVFVDGILGGSGTVANVSVSSIGTLSPGNSPGIITTGDLLLTDGSVFSVELDGVTAGTGYDQANVTGTVTLTGATLSTSVGFTPSVDDEFTIINNDNNDAIVGTFAGLPEGASLTIGGFNFIISYVGGDGNDVVLYVNEAPTAVGLSNSSIDENEPSGSLVGTFNTTDPDTGDTFTYTLVSGVGDDDNSAFAIDGSGNLLTAASFDYDTKSSYTIRVRSTDAGGLYTEQDFTISILPLNDNAPIFSSSATFSVVENTTAVGTVVATDADLPTQTVTYSISGGADAAKFTINPATGVLVFTVAPDYENPTDVGADNLYNVDVTADDGSGSTTVQNIAVTVTPLNDNVPIFSSSPTFNVVENTTAVGTVTATDADLPGQTVTYSITGGADSTLFSIDSATGVLTFNIAPNYESPTDAGANNVYIVDVTANDNSGSTTVQNIAVTVTPVNDNAPIFSSSPTFNVVENTTAVGTVTATDADLPGQTVTYSISGGADAAKFTINPATGVLVFNVAPDYENPTDVGADNVYNVDVTADDGSGSTTVQNIAVTVTAVNDNAPIFSSSATFSVVENTTAVGTVVATDADLPTQTVTYSITGGADAAKFTINPATGVLVFNVAPDYENPTDVGADNVYNVNVTANDNSGSTAVQNIAVTVTSVNDNAPIFSSSATFSVVENTTAVGTVVATDADLPTQTVTYSISGGADAAKFTINPATGVLVFNVAPDYENPTDVGADNVYNVDVTADDGSGSTTVQNIAVTVTAVNDNAPIFSSPASVNVAENSTVATTVIATDADLPSQQVTYSITGGVDRALFSINPNTGVLSFLTPPDYEHPTDVGANNSYEVQITANDGAGESTAQDLTVNVTNIVEEPVITLNPNDASYLLDKENAYVDPAADYQADVTETDYSAAQLTVSITVNRQPKDILSINPQGNKAGQINLKGENVLYGGVVIGTFQGGTRSKPNLVITFNSSASEAAVQALVKRITFFAKNERRASHVSRTVQMQVTNVSGHDSNQATRVINIMGAV